MLHTHTQFFFFFYFFLFILLSFLYRLFYSTTKAIKTCRREFLTSQRGGDRSGAYIRVVVLSDAIALFRSTAACTFLSHKRKENLIHSVTLFFFLFKSRPLSHGLLPAIGIDWNVHVRRAMQSRYRTARTSCTNCCVSRLDFI